MDILIRDIIETDKDSTQNIYIHTHKKKITKKIMSDPDFMDLFH
jgi:hypothetical protein